MFKVIIFIFVLIFLININNILCLIIPPNPCSDVFEYRQEANYIYGYIAIPYDGSNNLQLDVNTSMVGLYKHLPGLSLKLLTPLDDLKTIKRIDYRLNFPFRNVIPRITQIKYNNRIYCNGPPEPLTTRGVTNQWTTMKYILQTINYQYQPNKEQPIQILTTTTTTTTPRIDIINKNPFLSNIPENKPVIEQKPQNNDGNQCGVSNNIQNLVVNGESTIDNEFPWLVAMFRREDITYKFQCTANLVTNSHVITAAHCLRLFAVPIVQDQDILLALGCNDLEQWASESVLRKAEKVIVPPEYKQYSGHYDVAIIKMNSPVEYSAKIRPICLWSGDIDLEALKNKQGLVAGWGTDGNGKKTVAKPRKTTMPIVMQDTCLRSHQGFLQLTSAMTFCAGNRNGAGPCSGDSGAGFFMKMNNNSWQLRGLVSTAIIDQNYSCDLNEYIVFADLAKIKDFIMRSIG